MEKNFDRMAFNAKFDASLLEIQAAEKVTKVTLSMLSRLLLEQLRHDGDIHPTNRLLEVLTPMNKKTAVLFFIEFSGHIYSEAEGKFQKRDKARYAVKAKNAQEFLDDPHNNIWTWAERNLQLEAKPFDLSKIKKNTEAMLKRAEKEGFSKSQVISTILSAEGFDVQELLQVLDKMIEA